MKYQGYADVVELHSAETVISTCAGALYDDSGLTPWVDEKGKPTQAVGMRYMQDVKAIYVKCEGKFLALDIMGESPSEIDDEEHHFWYRQIIYNGTYSISWILNKEDIKVMKTEVG
jgi:hypothetical protein